MPRYEFSRNHLDQLLDLGKIFEVLWKTEVHFVLLMGVKFNTHGFISEPHLYIVYFMDTTQCRYTKL